MDGYLDLAQPHTAIGNGKPSFGSDITISGSGNVAVVGGVDMRDATLGIGFVFDVDTAGISPASSSYFIITSPVFPLRRYVVWYRTTTGSSPPNPAAEIGTLNPDIYWRVVSVNASFLSLPSQNDQLVILTAAAINGDPDFAEVVSAKSSGEVITITSVFSGTAGGVADTTVTPTNFTFTEIVAGEPPPRTGAFWPFT